jgi:cytochrome oxidase assembly protein ShyY1
VSDIDVNGMNKQDFDDKWLYRPVKLKGVFDNG